MHSGIHVLSVLIKSRNWGVRLCGLKFQVHQLLLCDLGQVMKPFGNQFPLLYNGGKSDTSPGCCEHEFYMKHFRIVSSQRW